MSQPLDSAPTTAREPLPWWILLRAPQFAMHGLPLTIAFIVTVPVMLLDHVAVHSSVFLTPVVTTPPPLSGPTVETSGTPSVPGRSDGMSFTSEPPNAALPTLILPDGSVVVAPVTVSHFMKPTLSATLVEPFGRVVGDSKLDGYTAGDAMSFGTAITWPVTHTMSYGQIAIIGPATLWQRLVALVMTLVLAGLWLLAGTAIARAVACQWTSENSVTFPRTTQYALNRWTSSLGGPLLPVVGIVVALMLTMLLVLPAKVLPWGLDEVYATIVSPLTTIATLLAGLLVAVLFGAAVLMPSAVAVDANDGFASFSRVFNYVTTRPWLAAGLAAGALLLSTLAWFAFGVLIWIGRSTLKDAMTTASGSTTAAMATHSLLLYLWAAYGASLFWTSATFVYLLLREAVDLVPVGVHAPWDDAANRGGEFQVVGMQAPVGPRTTEAAPATSTAMAPQSAAASGAATTSTTSLEDVATPPAPPTA